MDKYSFYVSEYITESNNYAPLWNGETSTAYGGGTVGLSDRYVAGFMWLDKLGLSALMGMEVVIRQALVGGGYCLIDPGHGNKINPVRKFEYNLCFFKWGPRVRGDLERAAGENKRKRVTQEYKFSIKYSTVNNLKFRTTG